MICRILRILRKIILRKKGKTMMMPISIRGAMPVSMMKSGGHGDLAELINNDHESGGIRIG